MKTKTLIKPNEKQLECIQNTEGKYLVLAGPGTGKTFTLIQRIVYMLKKGIDPSKILCLTYSDAAASEMKERLSKELDKNDVNIDIFTFHSFSSGIINEYIEEFNIREDVKVIKEAMSNQLLKECVEEINPKEFKTNKNDPYKMLPRVKTGIEEIQKNRLSKEQYFKNIEQNPNYTPLLLKTKEEIKSFEEQKKDTSKLLQKLEKVETSINKAIELWEFYELYKNKMETNRFIDFYDMISLVLDKFETDKDFLDKVVNKYEYLLVDEYQDTNKSQNDIIFNIVSALKSQNVFVVGDDDQIIYTFQGAKLDTMENYLKRFPDTKVICLTENMRSSQNILDFSRKVIIQDEKRLEINQDFRQYNINKELISKNEKLISKNQKVKCTKYFDLEAETIGVVDKIENLINSPFCPVDDKGNKKLSEIAILTRGNAQLEEFARLLKDKNIPFEIKNGKSIFEIKSSIVLIYYLQALVNPEKYSNKINQMLLTEPFKINNLDYVKIQKKQCDNKCFIDTLKEINDFCDKEKIDNFLKTFEYLKEYQTNETLRNVVVEVGSKTGIFDYFLNSEINKVENIQGIKKIIDEAIDFSSSYKNYNLSDFVEYLNIAQDENIEILTSKPPVENNAVQLLTYHSSKGREFEVVFMPTMMRANWEGDTKSLKPSIPVSLEEYKTDDELKEMKYSDRIKLMYVGLTRAKYDLNLSYVSSNYGRQKVPTPSDFIINLLEETAFEDKSDYKIENYIENISKLTNKKTFDYKKEFKELIDANLNNRAFSPSAINKYLKCKRQYLYSDILNLSSKYAVSDSLSYGSVIHEVLENAVKIAINKKSYPKSDEIIKDFERIIKKYPFTSFEQKQIHLERGKTALEKFYPIFIVTPIENIKYCEYKLSYSDKHSFYGIIDRIDKNPDGTYTIYDYKTGTAKPASSVTAGGKKEDYYNQLALYQYFCEKKENTKVKNSGIIFVEEFDKNVYLELSDEELQEVKDKFDKAIEDIYNCDFTPSFDKEVCKWCEYKEFCKMES